LCKLFCTHLCFLFGITRNAPLTNNVSFTNQNSFQSNQSNQLYPMSILLNLLVLIVFGWKQEIFAKKMEKLMHIIIITCTISSAVVPLVFQTYNPNCGVCNPTILYDTCSTKDGGKLCVLRGNEIVDFVLNTIVGAAVILALIFCTVAMVWVYLHVRRQEIRMQQYNFRQRNADNQIDPKRI